MTLKEYLDISDNTFSLQFEGFWYYHTKNYNILINTKTKKRWHNITDIEKIPLSLYLNLEPNRFFINPTDHNLEIYYNNKRIYFEAITEEDKFLTYFWGFTMSKITLTTINKGNKEIINTYTPNEHQ